MKKYLVLEEMSEYLSLLQEPQKWTQIKNLSTADVMIMDNSVPRTLWVTGKRRADDT